MPFTHEPGKRQARAQRGQHTAWIVISVMDTRLVVEGCPGHQGILLLVQVDIGALVREMLVNAYAEESATNYYDFFHGSKYKKSVLPYFDPNTKRLAI